MNRAAACRAVLTLLMAASSGAACAPQGADDHATDSSDAKKKGDAREADRVASARLFSNLDFETLDDQGAPVGWACGCGAAKPGACKVDDADASHGAHALVLGPGCYAYQVAKTFDASKAVRLDWFARGAHQYVGDVTLFADDGATYTELLAGPERADSTAWDHSVATGQLRTEGARRLLLMIQNSRGRLDTVPTKRPGEADLHIDDVVAVQDQPNPGPAVGSVLVAYHSQSFGLQAGSSEGVLYMPLPIDYASQVPLALDFKVEPASALGRLEYVQEDEGNWGVVLHFPAAASASTLKLSWRAAALVRAVPRSEIGQVYTKRTDPSRWSSPSAIAESDYAPLAATATSLVPATASAEERMTAIVGWTSHNIGANGPMTALDAKTVYDTRVASCTGFANTASAMGRALGVPTRHVANILVGQSQQMHSINEFWLGEALGWRRVEPQAPQPYAADDYGFIMRLVLPTDEVGTPFGMPGIPLNEFTEYRAGVERFGMPADQEPAFFDCNICWNRADRVALLRGTAEDMASLSDLARERWQQALANYARGIAQPASEKAFEVRTLDDVRALLAP